MKIVKALFIFALVSMITISCKETKKDEVQDESAVEMTEEGSASDDLESADGESEGVTEASTGEDEAPMGEAEAIEGESAGVEEMAVSAGVIAEKMADTPVIYPGCEGANVDEVRACSKEKFISFLKKEFKSDIANGLELREGSYSINSIVQIDEKGKCSALKIDGPHADLKKEMMRVIDMLPQLTPATKDGKPVSVSFVLPVNFKLRG